MFVKISQPWVSLWNHITLYTITNNTNTRNHGRHSHMLVVEILVPGSMEDGTVRFLTFFERASNLLRI